MPVGQYQAFVATPGFRTEVREGIVLQVGQRARLDVILQAGNVVETVNVTAQVPVVNTEDSVFGDVIENKRMVDDKRARPDPEFFPGFVRMTGLKAYKIVMGHTRVIQPDQVWQLMSNLTLNRGRHTIVNLSQRGLSGSHRAHVWVTSSVYELPFGSGRKFLNRRGGGWQLSSIIAIQSGGAFAVTLQDAAAGLNTGTDQRPNRLRDANLPSEERTIFRWFDTSAFVRPPQYTFGSEETRTVFMPGLANVDASLKKSFRLLESTNLEFRAEFFNLFNRTNFGQPGNVLGNPSFGIISSSGPARVGQMSLKLVF